MTAKTAIIGLSCLFPGADTLGAYWRALKQGRDCRSAAREEDFGLALDATPGIVSLRGGFVRDFRFDPAGLDLDPKVLEGLDASFLWTLHAAREAVRDAGEGGVTPDAGLILGNYTFPTPTSNRMVTPLWRAEMARGAAQGWGIGPDALAVRDSRSAPDAANRHVCGLPAPLAARALGLAGPSFSLDAACASALYAIDLASAYLRAGKARSMLAGALCAPDPWLIHLSFSELGAFPPNGIAQPFDARSQGIVTGQGASIAALKLLDHAIADGNDILCVIDGVGLSNDGSGRHMLAPNPRGQALVYERAYADTGVDPAEIDYVECHATGTPLGDRTEIASLGSFFEARGGAPRFGSVKGNLGHLLTVAGMSSLTKVAIAMREGEIPPTIGVEEPVKGVSRLVRGVEPWEPSEGRPRRGAVSSFGFGGANAHMVVSAPAEAKRSLEAASLAAKPAMIVGMAAHLGGLETLEAVESAFFDGNAAMTAPSERRRRGVEVSPSGAYVDEICLDPLASRVPPAETAHFNPQHALALRVCEAALADAGFARKADALRNVAVIVAIELDLSAHLRRAGAELPAMLDTWEARLSPFSPEDRAMLREALGSALHGEVKSAEILSYIGNLCAARLSSLYDFTGPSYTVSGDGLGAVHAVEAAQMLLAEGRAEAAVVAAVDLSGDYEDVALSDAAHPGEGAAALVLAPGASGSKGYALLESVSAARRHDPSSVLLDPDAGTVQKALDAVRAREAGFADTGAEDATVPPVSGLIGTNPVLNPMAGIIRGALALWRRRLPFSPETLPWVRKDRERPLRAVVGAPGFGGGYGVVSLTEASADRTRPPMPMAERGLRFLPVEGCDAAALRAALDVLIGRLEGGEPLAAIQAGCIGAATHDDALRAVLIGTTREGLLAEAARLRGALGARMTDGQPFQTPAGSYFAPAPLGKAAKIAFVYPGGFNSYPFLGRGLLAAFPDALRRFEAGIANPAEALTAHALWPQGVAASDGRALMKREVAMMDDIATMITGGASFALLYSDILRTRFGVRPSACFGYSLGETSMLFDSGVWPPEARSVERVQGSQLLRTGIAGPKTVARAALGLDEGVKDRDVWRSLVIFADADAVIAAAETAGDVFVTHVNTPKEVVIAGRPDAVAAFAEALGAQTFRSPVSHVLHCEPLGIEFDAVKALNDFPTAAPEDGPVLYSARNCAPLDRFDREGVTETVAEVMCRAVDFRRLTERAYADGARIFVECGPSATCTRWIGETLGARPHLALPLDQRGADDLKSLYAALARLFAHGVPLDLSPLTPRTADAAPRAMVVVRPGGAALARTARDTALRIALPKPAAPSDAGGAPPLVYGPALSTLFPENMPMTAPLPAADLAPRRAARRVSSGGAVSALALAPVQADTDPETLLSALLDLPDPDAEDTATAIAPAAPGPRLAPRAEGLVWDEQDLLNFADGKVADIFGEDFAEIDGFPVRVRLPSKPYFFVSRVTTLDAQPGAYKPCSLTTEYDIPEDAWYLVDGQMPPGIAVEAGQSDLLLVAWLGIDRKNRGQRKYRLLDGKLRFKGPLPRAGQTLRFDIEITSFVWQGDMLLFFFRYKGYADGKLALELESGCAGFFTEAELEAGGGVVLKGLRRATESLWKPLERARRDSLDECALRALCEGRTGEIFGPAHRGVGDSMRLPPEMLRMVDRVTDLGSWREEEGVRAFVIEAEKDLDPEGWYYASHFVDDPVLPGSLAAEGATQVLKAYLLANGFHLAIADPEFDSIPELLMEIKVRGQITPKVDTLRYEVRVVETGILPRPFIRADVIIWHGEKPLVSVTNLGLQIREKGSVAPRLGDETWDSGRRTARGEKVLLSELHLAHAAKGDLRTAMGEEFGIYGAGHRAPHIPNGCFQFVDRGVSIDGMRGAIKPGATMVNEYDSPADAWYYTENSYPRMPNCVHLEGALQAAILLGYYLGPTLKFPDRVYSIRNLDGRAVYLADVDTRGRTMRHTETLKSNALIPDSILQSFDFKVECEGTPVYEGWSSFGYFTEKALAVQLGLDNGKTRRFWDEEQGKTLTEIDLGGKDAARYFTGGPRQPHYRLAGGRFRLLHNAWMSETGGRYGAGYVRGYRQVKTEDWYFTNHFHRDPVQPGSLGLESMLQSIQLYALAHGIGAEFASPRFGIAVGVPVEWKYRGQILRKDRDMFTETHIREVRREPGRIVIVADADLCNGRLPIYQTRSMSVAITEAEG